MKLKKYIFMLVFCLIIVVSCSESMPLKEYKDATTLRDKAIRYDLQNYSKEQFDIAEANYSEAMILIDENKDSAKVKELLTTASNSYQTVLNDGLPQYAEVLKSEIDLERVYSKEVKAYRVDKENYEFAELNYINALSALSTKKYHHKAYFTTKIRYDESTRGIKEAEDKIRQVEELERSSSKK